MPDAYDGGADPAQAFRQGQVDQGLVRELGERGEDKCDDLSHILQVALGRWTEAFNRQRYQRQTGNAVLGSGTAVACPIHEWRRCTLDGYEKGAIWEVRHTSAFAKPEEVLARYMPQLQHNMAVRGADRAILSVI